MQIYTAEIGGRPIAAFNASSLTKAAEIIEDPFILRDQFVVFGLCSEDEEISLRSANPHEVAEWTRLNGRAIMLDQFGPRDSEDEMLGVVFLVDVVDPTADEHSI
jgi:hypothetical protein